MKKQIKRLLSIATIGTFLIVAYASGSGTSTTVSSTDNLKTLILANDFFGKSNLSEDHTLSFQNNSFSLALNDKRSGAIRKFTGNYEVKSSKYSDNGKEFFYVKLVFEDKSWADEAFYVFYDGNLVEPSASGVLDKNEDEYGLNIPEWHVSLAPDYNIYEPIDK
jgi:hypothetical protein